MYKVDLCGDTCVWSMECDYISFSATACIYLTFVYKIYLDISRKFNKLLEQEFVFVISNDFLANCGRDSRFLNFSIV